MGGYSKSYFTREEKRFFFRVVSTETVPISSQVFENTIYTRSANSKFIYFQAKLADTNAGIKLDDPKRPESETPAAIPNFETHKVFMHKTRDELRFNLEHVLSNGEQEEIVEELGPFLKTSTNDDKIPNVTFHYIAEEVYLKKLCRPFKRIGYHGVFTRYNADKGIASFNRRPDADTDVKYSVFKSEKPNVC